MTILAFYFCNLQNGSNNFTADIVQMIYSWIVYTFTNTLSCGSLHHSILEGCNSPHHLVLERISYLVPACHGSLHPYALYRHGSVQCPAGLFLGIWNWGGAEGGRVLTNVFAGAQIYIKKHLKKSH